MIIIDRSSKLEGSWEVCFMQIGDEEVSKKRFATCAVLTKPRRRYRFVYSVSFDRNLHNRIIVSGRDNLAN